MSLLGYPQIIPYTKFEHVGIIRLSNAADKHTIELENPTHADQQNFLNN